MSRDPSEQDLELAARRGISRDEVERQLALLRDGRRYTRLERPCTVGDGIARIDAREADALLEAHAEAAAAGRFTKFVPASGAATRMFRELSAFLDSPGRSDSLETLRGAAGGGDAVAAAVVRLVDELERFPFYEPLDALLAARGRDARSTVAAGDHAALIEALLGDDGLGYAQAPKGLLPFHRYAEGTRTAFEEHLVEAADYVRSSGGQARVHFTVSPEHRAGFDALLERVGPHYERRHDATFDVDYSVQKPSTDTIAVDADGGLFRDERGQPVFRPAGHGALIANLGELDADLVYVKNIDNVQSDRAKPVVSRFKRLLGGYLVRLERRAHELLERLHGARQAEGIDEAARFAASRLHVELDGRLDPDAPDVARAWLIERLTRPIRVCGVVPNTGEPGGGPFWVRDDDGSLSLQLVETAQVDPHDAGQQQTIAGATHFSPVDLVCALRDRRGRAYDLDRFVDPRAVIVSEKSSGGRALRALERPGLWNGAMAGWNTVFVEVPIETFTPVKTVFDLLRPEHDAGG